MKGTSGVLSQKLVDKVFPFGVAVPEPRQGRKIVAQGASPGRRSPHPAFGTPLPSGRERGRGEREGSRTRGWRRGLPSFARSAG